jgi:hypothetical protein
MAITGKIIIQTILRHLGTADLSTPVETFQDVFESTVASGTGLDQLDMIWHDQRTLAASTAENLDLAGSLVDVFGNTMTFARVKLIVIVAAVENGGLIQVGGAAANGLDNLFASLTDIIQVRAGGAFMVMAPDATGYVVTGGTADILKINNTDAGDPATYDIYIAGASA